MIAVTTFKGRKVAVFGMARSGIAAGRALLAGSAEVACWDDGAKGRAAAEAAGLPLADLREADWGRFAALVLSPGVPLTHPVPHWTVAKAKAAGVPVIGDTELFFRELALQPAGARPKVVGITGTNGKSTTTALTAHLLLHAGKRVAMGGNIGEAVLGLAPFAEIDVYVLEFSSYQIDLTPGIACDVGVLLNLSPDHLDRHGDMAGYAAVKERLVAGASTAIVGLDDHWCRDIARRRLAAGGPTVGLNVDPDPTRPAGAVTAADLTDFRERGGNLVRVAPNGEIQDGHKTLAGLAGIPTLRGTHNAQNAAASAVTVSLLYSLDAQAGLRTYPGLAHRMELLGSVGAVSFVNDSKATNADSTAKALNSFGDGIHWILGGKAKDGGIESLTPFFKHVAHAYLIGEATEAFAATLVAHGVGFSRCGTLAGALGEISRRLAIDAPSHLVGKSDLTVASKATPHPVPLPTGEGTKANGGPAPAFTLPGGEGQGEGLNRGRTEPSVVLLSPACASFDQFKDFEDRGDQFRKLVAALPGFVRFGGKAGL